MSKSALAFPIRKRPVLSFLASSTLLLAGTTFAQDACTVVTDTPPCIGEVQLDSPNMNVTGRSVTLVPGEDLVFTAQAYTGASTHGSREPTECSAWQFRVLDNNGNPIPFEQSGAAGRIVIPAANALANGIGRTEAVCLDNPSIASEATIQTPLAMPVVPPPAPLAGEAAMAAGRSGSVAAPNSGMMTTGKTSAAGGGNGGGAALLIGGAVVLGGVAIGVAASALSDTASTSGGSGGWYADWACTSSQCASVMGAWSGSAGPFATQAACVSWTQTYIIAPCNYR